MKISKKEIIGLIFLLAIAGYVTYFVTSFIVEKKPEKEAILEPISIPKKILNFTGDLIKKEENILLVETFDLSSDYYEIKKEQPKRNIKVIIGQNTKILNYQKEPIDLDYLQTGNKLAITAKSNIRHKDEIEAVEVLLLPDISLPEPIEF